MSSGLRILIDATRHQGGGGFTYVADMLPELVRSAPEDQFRVLLRNDRLADAMPALPNLEVDRMPQVGVLGRLRFNYLEAPRLAKAWEADLYFSTGEDAPLTAPCPTIGMCQNFNVFTPLADPWPDQPEFRGSGAAARMASSSANRLRLMRALARMTSLRASRMLFVSETAANCIGDVLHLPASRRAVVHHGIDMDRWRPTDDCPPIGRPYILSVGSVYRYKNFVRLIEAWHELARRQPRIPDLVLIGDEQDGEYAESMRAARAAAGPLAKRIHLLDEVPHHEIHRYYAGASLFVFPSLLETFGLPMLEAMASGVPLVASDLPVFREIAADAAFYADPHSPAAFANAMEEVLFRDGAAEVLVKRGQERVRDFTWQRAARQMLVLFREVVSEHATRRNRGLLPAARAAVAHTLALLP